MIWWRQVLTDYDNTTWDTGRVITALVVLSGVYFTWYTVVMLQKPFDPQSYGIGMGSLLGGLGVYLMGDNKRPTPGITTTVETGRKTTTTIPPSDPEPL